jgi:hypothetical protein
MIVKILMDNKIMTGHKDRPHLDNQSLQMVPDH